MGERHSDAPWVLGRGWYYQPFPGGLPTRQQLDAIVSDRPAQIISYDGHTSWVNTRALRLARITQKNPEPAARRHREGPEDRRADRRPEGSRDGARGQSRAEVYARRPRERPARRDWRGAAKRHHQHSERQRQR